MKHKSLVVVFPIIALSLTSCFEKVLTKAEFLERIEKVEEQFDIPEKYNNISISSGLAQPSYSYKEGEFYRYSNGLILLNETEATWKDEDGKFYYYHNAPFTDLIYKEIDEDEFETKMVYAHNRTMNVIIEVVETMKEFINDEYGEYESVKSSYVYDPVDVEYIMTSSYVRLVPNGYDEHGEQIYDRVKGSFEYTIKANFLTKVVNKEGKTTKTTNYSYGTAKFVPPVSNPEE